MNNHLALLTQTFNSQTERIAGPQIDRGLLSKTYAGGRTGGNHIAGLKAHKPAQIAHKIRHTEDHCASCAVLIAVSIDVEPHLKVLRIGHLFGC